MERPTLEQQIFDWVSWDDDEDPSVMHFADITLKVPVGSFPAGSKFPFASWIGGNSVLILQDDQDVDHVFELTVMVGNKIELPEHSDDDCEDYEECEYDCECHDKTQLN